MNIPKNDRSKSGFSLVEMIVVIAVLGIIAGIAVSSFGGLLEKSSDGVAGNVVSTLNKATREYSHSNADLIYEAFAASAADELIVLRALQYKSPSDSIGLNELNPKGPFMRPDWQPTTSNLNSDYRITWTGSAWKLLKPGVTGTGLKLVFDGSDLGVYVIFPPNFQLPAFL